MSENDVILSSIGHQKMTARHEAPTLDDDKHAKMRDMVMTWEEISDELIWGDYDVNGPDIQKIDPDRLEAFCKRFPHFEGQLRSFVDDWNREPMITQEMLAAIEHTEVSQEEIDKSWRSAKRILDFYTKLRSVEKERDELRGRLLSIEQAAGMPEPEAYMNTRNDCTSVEFQYIEGEGWAHKPLYGPDLLAHCLHLADKLARMEALMREPDDEMVAAGMQACVKHGAYFPPEDDSEWSVAFKAMSAALLAKLEKEK